MVPTILFSASVDEYVDKAKCDQIIDKQLYQICYSYKYKGALSGWVKLDGNLVGKSDIKKRPKFYTQLFAFPLGAVIDNQRKTGLNSGAIDSFEINIHSGLLEQKKLKDIPQLEAFMEQIPAKINGYSALWHKNQQNYSVFTDTNGRTIIFPHYEIARYFYFTSSSMTRQLMAVSSEHRLYLHKGTKCATVIKYSFY